MTNQRSKKLRVLFICVHNSGRSQMAEAFLKALAGDRFQAESAGFSPTRIHPLVIKAMHEAGIDLSKNQTRSVFRLYQEATADWRTAYRHCGSDEASNEPPENLSGIRQDMGNR